MQNKVYRFGEAEVSNVDSPRGKHFSSVVTTVRTILFISFHYREVYRVTETLQREKSGLLKQLDFLR